MPLAHNLLAQLSELKGRLQKSRDAFRSGQLILVGDDGKRENEVDIVFHAHGATPQNVNFAITHGRGMLCVSLSTEIADKLGFYLSPQYPVRMRHTHFTISVDAREGITTGISAKDRAHTIALMARNDSGPHSFLTPGHVHPLIAREGGLLTRAGHTEAIYDLCRLERIPCVAALCEILKEDGETLNTRSLTEKENISLFSSLPFVSTIDILWGKVLLEEPPQDSCFVLDSNFTRPPLAPTPQGVYVLKRQSEHSVTLPTVVALYARPFHPEKIRISITNGLFQWDNGICQNTCCAEIALIHLDDNCLQELPRTISQFCDLSQKEGLQKTLGSVKRVVSILRSAQFLFKHQGISQISTKKNPMEKMNLPVKADQDFLAHCWQKQNSFSFSTT